MDDILQRSPEKVLLGILAVSAAGVLLTLCSSVFESQWAILLLPIWLIQVRQIKKIRLLHFGDTGDGYASGRLHKVISFVVFPLVTLVVALLINSTARGMKAGFFAVIIVQSAELLHRLKAVNRPPTMDAAE